MKLTKIDYSEIKNEVIPDEIKNSFQDVDFSDINKIQMRKVKSPFIIADNYFDLAESNNDMEFHNVFLKEHVSFTGGDMYSIYEKDDPGLPAYILQGNDEQGFNLFIIQ
jgi:hypothetical protein